MDEQGAAGRRVDAMTSNGWVSISPSADATEPAPTVS
jgi:hypothetical protein